MRPETLGIWGGRGISTRESDQEEKNRRTFDHFSGREGVICTFEVAGCVVEHEETLRVAIYFGPKDVDRTIDLRKERRPIKISVAIFFRLEHDTSLSVVSVADG
jgi:hypothetical protein